MAFKKQKPKTYQSKTIQHKCEVCDSPFTTYRLRNGTPKRIHCGHACTQTAYRDRQNERIQKAKDAGAWV